MNYKKEYQKYLASPAWKQLRAQARRRSGDKCEFCGGPPDHVHHIRYPKRYKEDHVDNLVVACASCHSKLHGVRDDLYVETWVGEAIGIQIINGKIYIETNFTPVPEKFRNPIPLSHIAERHGEDYAKRIQNQFDVDPFDIGSTYTIKSTLDSNMFGGMFDNYSVEDFLQDLLEYDFDINNGELLSKYFRSVFSIGPTYCVCKGA